MKSKKLSNPSKQSFKYDYLLYRDIELDLKNGKKRETKKKQIPKNIKSKSKSKIKEQSLK